MDKNVDKKTEVKKRKNKKNGYTIVSQRPVKGKSLMETIVICEVLEGDVIKY